MQDSTKLKNFFFSGNVQVTDAQFNAASSTKAKVKARGNDIQLVNILATGGSLNCTDLAQWMLGAEPEKAAMVGMQVHPIYDIFDGSNVNSDEGKARAYLVDYIDKNFSLDENKYGNELTIDLSDLK
jgi:UDP-N-acetylglucosamine:LPS N-acetylglucosamine transferase